MNDRLATYLQDHLAGSHFAVKLLDSLHEQYRDEKLGKFALALCADVKKDQDTLQKIVERVGKTHFDLTEATGWLVQKASQFKLQRDDSSGGLGTFEALETLALGIRGKLSLWQALDRIREFDGRISGHDFKDLAARADEQYDRAEEQRLQLIRLTFGPESK